MDFDLVDRRFDWDRLSQVAARGKVLTRLWNVQNWLIVFIITSRG
ncbi:MAG: hypothetical protein ONA90_04130 [candidate division KSB1 bacterium]|nr:hypothetical protein [candidate division KSB1 bacterium]